MKKNFFLFLILFVTGLAGVTGCAPKPVSQEGGLTQEGSKSHAIEPEARPLYFQAERAFTAKNFDLAQKYYTQVRQKFPRTRAAAYSAYRSGIIHYYKENYPAASHDFESHLTQMPDSEFAFDTTYNWAAAEFQQNHFDKAYQVLARLKYSDVQAQGPRRAEIVYALTARIATALNNHPGAIAATALQLLLPQEESTRSALYQRVDEHLKLINDKARLEQLQNEVTEPLVKTKIAARIAQLSPTLEATPIITPPLPGGSIDAGQRPLNPGSTGQKLNVGVLLPLTGRFAPYGKRALDGILLASKVFAPNETSGFHLFIKDTASNPLVAQNAVDELVQNNDVMAIVGPLSWKESLSAADRAQQLGVLNLSLTTKEGISQRGPYLFQNALTPRVQLDSLVRFCIGEKQFKRFAILAPNNAFGHDLTKQFWDLVEKYGGKIVDYQTYAPEDKDFQNEIREMTGLSDPRFRRLEQAKLGEYLKDQKTKTGKDLKVQLPSIVDFDAIFIPDSPKTVSQIAPSLAYFDVSGVPLLGTTEWNSPQLYSRGGRYVEGAIFPAGLILNSKNPTTQAFIKAYESSYGTSPDQLAAQAYEAMQLVAASLGTVASGDRNQVVNQLASLKDFETPLGKVTFDTDRIAIRRLPIMTLESGGTLSEH